MARFEGCSARILRMACTQPHNPTAGCRESIPSIAQYCFGVRLPKSTSDFPICLQQILGQRQQAGARIDTRLGLGYQLGSRCSVESDTGIGKFGVVAAAVEQVHAVQQFIARFCRAECREENRRYAATLCVCACRFIECQRSVRKVRFVVRIAPHAQVLKKILRLDPLESASRAQLGQLTVDQFHIRVARCVLWGRFLRRSSRKPVKSRRPIDARTCGSVIARSPIIV